MDFDHIDLTNPDVVAARDRLFARIGPNAPVRLVMRGDGKLVVEHVHFVPDAAGTLIVEPLVDFEEVIPTPEPPEPVTTTKPATVAEHQPMGEAGYNRLLELLQNPPIGTPGLPPPSTEIPTDLKDWLQAFKEPLVYMTVEAAMSAVKAKIGGYSRGRLKELYSNMDPADIAAVMSGNAAIIKKFADQRSAEAAMLASISDKVTEVSASLLLKLLMAV